MLHAVSEKSIRALADSLISRPARETAPRHHLRVLFPRALSALHVEACKHLCGVGASSDLLLISPVHWVAYVLRSPLALRALSACGRYRGAGLWGIRGRGVWSWAKEGETEGEVGDVSLCLW